ncbi:MAG: transcription elongation factor GreA [Eubacteriales bacterium]|nr:transcription elongation factor GreA [Eubacteriales bacterium]MDD4323834.1 transcription elongation factor GreA [Eubacteriales bacterium]MDD4540674.1 transcription elongation factor GreA [Eubacteriales bacterium]
MAEKAYELTYNGLNELHAELEDRKTRVAEEIAERLKQAREFGDISENSEFEEATAAKADNEIRIHEIEKILKNSTVIEEKRVSKTRVSLGGQVCLRDEETGEEDSYLIVGAQEEDVFNGKLSNESPVGAALIGKQKGQVVEVKTPSGMLKYKIIDISLPKGVHNNDK